jgi:hypothetical protein
MGWVKGVGHGLTKVIALLQDYTHIIGGAFDHASNCSRHQNIIIQNVSVEEPSAARVVLQVGS